MTLDWSQFGEQRQFDDQEQHGQQGAVFLGQYRQRQADEQGGELNISGSLVSACLKLQSGQVYDDAE